MLTVPSKNLATTTTGYGDPPAAIVFHRGTFLPHTLPPVRFFPSLRVPSPRFLGKPALPPPMHTPHYPAGASPKGLPIRKKPVRLFPRKANAIARKIQGATLPTTKGTPLPSLSRKATRCPPAKNCRIQKFRLPYIRSTGTKGIRSKKMKFSIFILHFSTDEWPPPYPVPEKQNFLLPARRHPPFSTKVHSVH